MRVSPSLEDVKNLPSAISFLWQSLIVYFAHFLTRIYNKSRQLVRVQIISCEKVEGVLPTVNNIS